MILEDWNEHQRDVLDGIADGDRELRDRLDAERATMPEIKPEQFANQLMGELGGLQCWGDSLAPCEADLQLDPDDGNWKGHITFAGADGLDLVVTVTISVDEKLRCEIEVQPHNVSVA